MDTVSKETRSRIMGSIKAQSKLESIVSKALWHEGLRFRRNVKKLYGTPDLAIQKYKLVIFIDSCYWHKCPLHGTIPKSNTEFWINKFNKNQERDKKVTTHYINHGWTILRYWEHDVRNSLENVLKEIIKTVEYLKSGS